MNTSARLRKVEDKLNAKQRSKHIIWPILGGASSGESYRDVTPQEGQMLVAKGQPVPIGIALNKEEEFLAYLESE